MRLLRIKTARRKIVAGHLISDPVDIADKSTSFTKKKGFLPCLKTCKASRSLTGRGTNHLKLSVLLRVVHTSKVPGCTTTDYLEY